MSVELSVYGRDDIPNDKMVVYLNDNGDILFVREHTMTIEHEDWEAIKTYIDQQLSEAPHE